MSLHSGLVAGFLKLFVESSTDNPSAMFRALAKVLSLESESLVREDSYLLYLSVGL